MHGTEAEEGTPLRMRDLGSTRTKLKATFAGADAKAEAVATTESECDATKPKATLDCSLTPSNMR
jgi:hypothetical protein